MSEEGFDFEATYSCSNQPGIAWRVVQFHETSHWRENWVYIGEGNSGLDDEDNYVDEGYWDDSVDTSRVVAYMVGDNQMHILERDELTKLEDDEFCSSCGQTGCGHE